MAGGFDNIDEIRRISEKYYIFLEKKASLSPLIYRLTTSDLDFEAPKNYQKKWKIDNPIDLYKDQYQQEVFFKDYVDDINQYAGNSINSTIENSNFRINSYFRGDVIGFNKKKRKFFPMIVLGCSHGCGYYAKFISDYSVRLENQDSPGSLIFDLSKNTISTEP